MKDHDRHPSCFGVRPRPDWVREFIPIPHHASRLVIDAPAALKGKQIEELVRRRRHAVAAGRLRRSGDPAIPR